MEKYSISLDWLQYYVEGDPTAEIKDFQTTRGNYTVEKAAYGTPLWQEVFNIKHRGREWATLCRRPRTSGMPERGMTIKLANRILYSHMWLQESKEILAALNLRYKGITRVDVCYDCNKLAGGRSVPEFLMQYFSHAPYCSGHIVRSGSRKVDIHAVRTNAGAVEISAMRWGSKGSDIGAYCYNKTLELREVKDKPWIRETWEKAGLVDIFDDYSFQQLSEKERKRAIEFGNTGAYIKEAVWRFEISIKAHGKDLLNLDTGEIFRLDLNYFERQNAVENLFYTYAQKVLDFRVSTGQTTIRNYEKMKIFEMNEEPSERPINISVLADTGRTEKIIINRLEQLKKVYGDIDGVEKKSLQTALDFVRTIAGAKQGMLKARRNAEALDGMKQRREQRNIIDEYLSYVDFCWEKRRQIDAANAFSYWQSLEMECRLLSMNPQDSEVTPIW